MLLIAHDAAGFVDKLAFSYLPEQRKAEIDE
jgi:hypothetical protein